MPPVIRYYAAPRHACRCLLMLRRLMSLLIHMFAAMLPLYFRRLDIAIRCAAFTFAATMLLFDAAVVF